MRLFAQRAPLGRAFTTFNFLVGAVGLLFLLPWATWAWLRTEPFGDPGATALLASTFLGLFVAARLLRFELPPNITASLIVPIQLASILLLGAVPTALLTIPAFLTEVWKEKAFEGLEGARLRTMISIIALNLGMEVLVTLSAGACWRLLNPGSGLDTSPQSLLALLATFLVFKGVNELILASSHWLRGASVGDYAEGARPTVLIETLTLPMAVLLVLAWENLDRVAFFFVFALLLAAFVVRTLTRTQSELSLANTDLQRKVREIETLAEIGRAISADIEQESLLATIHERCADILDARHFFIALYTEGEPTLHVALDLILGEKQEPQDIPLGEGLTSHVIMSRQPLLVRDLEIEAPDLPVAPIVHPVTETPNRSWLGCPMIAKGEVVGAIVLQATDPNAYDDDDARVLSAIASQAAISVKNARLHREALHALRVEAENLELKRLNSKKSEFVNMVAHQFRTPLTTVIGYANLLVERALKHSDSADGVPDLQRHLGTVQSESKRLALMVEELLNLSRIRSGHLPLTRQRFDLNRLAKETIASHQLLADERGQQLVLESTEELSVDGDSNFIRQALGNLVSNALKYAPDGSRVAVRTAVDGELGELRVIDEGPGVPAEDLERIFDEFYRAAGPTLDMPGTGLGLSIVRGIVEAHGGRAWAERTGEGTAFCFTLPLDGAASRTPPELTDREPPRQATG